MGLRVVFMGTPDFAVNSLKAIHESSQHEVVGVVTSADKPAGRGRKIQESAVKKYAVQHKLNLLQPEKLKGQEFLDQLKEIACDIQVVVAFRMLPEVVWAMPKLGTFNLHASLLPQYRGAAPINWAVINGETQTGVTTFFLKHQIDTGDVIDQETTPIEPEDNASSVHDKLMEIGANLVVKTLDKIESNNYSLKPQVIEGETKEAPKIFKQDCLIDTSCNVEKIHNKIRGLSYYPGAYLNINIAGKESTLKVFRSEIVNKNDHTEIGLNSDNKNYIHLELREGTLELLEVQIAGKKRMSTKDLLRGFSTDVNTIKIV